MDMTKQERDKLRALALAATPGEWAVNGGDDLDMGDDRVYIGDVENAAYIAAANPKTVLTLLDRVDELEKQEPVAQSKNGQLFWCGDPTEYRGVDCDLFLAPQTPAVPVGWQLVPVEPTPEMLNATSWPNCARTDYKHMLAAAPGAGGGE